MTRGYHHLRDVALDCAKQANEIEARGLISALLFIGESIEELSNEIAGLETPDAGVYADAVEDLGRQLATAIEQAGKS